MMMSPGRTSMEREAIEIMSGTGQISLAMSESCFAWPFTTSQMRPELGWPTLETGWSGAMGAEKSKSLPQSHGRPCSRAWSCRSRLVARKRPTSQVDTDRVTEHMIESSFDRDIETSFPDRHDQRRVESIASDRLPFAVA